MAKYIERSILPQFKYYNSYLGKDFSWNVDFTLGGITYVDFDDGHWGYNSTAGENSDFCDMNAYEDTYEELCDLNQTEIKKTEVLALLAQKDAAFVDKIRHELVKHGFRDSKYREIWENRLGKSKKEFDSKDVVDITDQYDFFMDRSNIMTLFAFVQLAQGSPTKFDLSGEVHYPKLLLVEADLYKKCKEADFLDIDFGFLTNALQDETPVIVVNGESAERKMFFVLVREQERDSERCLAYMVDPSNGVSEFVLARHADDNSATIGGNILKCHVRGDYWAADCADLRAERNMEERNIEDAEDESYYSDCYYGKDAQTCPRKMMKIIAAITYCYVEYKKKMLNKKIADEKNKYSGARDKDRTQPFVPSTMIKMYDIKMTEEEKIRFNKYNSFSKNGSSHMSVEKCPHIRRGTLRYNPKTGQKDIRVRGSIVHADRYSGFSSADRVKE